MAEDLQMTRNCLDQMIRKIREIRNVVPGVTRQLVNPDLGFVGQAYEDLIYGAELPYIPHILEDPATMTRLMQIAESEIAHPEKFQ